MKNKVWARTLKKQEEEEKEGQADEKEEQDGEEEKEKKEEKRVMGNQREQCPPWNKPSHTQTETDSHHGHEIGNLEHGGKEKAKVLQFPQLQPCLAPCLFVQHTLLAGTQFSLESRRLTWNRFLEKSEKISASNKDENLQGQEINSCNVDQILWSPIPLAASLALMVAPQQLWEILFKARRELHVASACRFSTQRMP